MDLHFAGAHEIAARIRAGRLTSLAAVEHHIARITCLDRRINAVCVRDFARARRHDPLTSTWRRFGPTLMVL